MLGVRISAATDLSRLNRKWQLHCLKLGIRCECHRSSEMTIINGCPCHISCCTLKNPHCSMAINAEHTRSLQPFTGNGDVSIRVKNSRVGRTNKSRHIQRVFHNILIWALKWQQNSFERFVHIMFGLIFRFLINETNTRSRTLNSAHWLRLWFDWLIDWLIFLEFLKVFQVYLSSNVIYS